MNDTAAIIVYIVWGQCLPPLHVVMATAPLTSLPVSYTYAEHADRKRKSSVLQIPIVGCRRLEVKLNAAYVVLLGATHGT